MKLIGIFLIALLLGQQSSMADNVANRQRRLAIYNVQQTVMGRALLEQFYNEEHLYSSVFISEVPANRLFYVSTFDYSIHLSGNLMAAAPEYNSWVLAIGLQNRKLVAQCGYTDIYEYVILGYISAFKHWQGLGAPLDRDYVDHPNDNVNKIPKMLDASVNKYHHLYKTLPRPEFAQRVLGRLQRLNQPMISLVDKIQSLDPDRNSLERDCLKRQYENYLEVINQ